MPFHSELAKSVLSERYFVKDDDGNPAETWEEMCERVADAAASAEKDDNARIHWAKAFRGLMLSGTFLPNSPTLMNAGLGDGLLSACFVLPIEDNMESIFGTLTKTALVQKAGGGTGFSFSRLRPIGAKVGPHGGTSSGVVSFISVYDQAGEVIKQGGRRRAANMGMLRVDHPEIVGFVGAKEKDGVLSNFNLSVAITDDFLRKVKDMPHEPMECYHPSTGSCWIDQNGNWYSLGVDTDKPGPDVSECITYGQLFALICEKAWSNGEPGIFFIDTANKNNPAPELGDIEATNPCGEQPLLPYESCNLGSINLSHMVDDQEGGINWRRLSCAVQIAVRFLDNVIDVNSYPIPEIEEMTKKLRPIGLGVMGFADMLIKLGTTYGSPESIVLAEKVMEHIDYEAHAMSQTLAKLKGPCWPGGDKRNSQITTVAPTGTLSIIAGCSSGIEPVFRWAYKRKAVDKEFIEAHPLYKPFLDGPRAGEDPPEYFVTAGQVPWKAHIDIQAAFQQHTDAGISKTINLPYSATVEDVMAAILYAHEMGCKGLTVYRDNSRANQVIDKVDKEGEYDETMDRPDVLDNLPSLPRGVVAYRPDVTFGMTKRYKIACGKLYVTYNADLTSDEPCEIFVQSSESGGCSANTKALGMVISLALRCGMDPNEIVGRLRKVVCPACRGKKGLDAKSCPDAIAKAMVELHLIDGVTIPIASADNRPEAPAHKPCPDCGEPMNKESGCWVCKSCGYSKCG